MFLSKSMQSAIRVGIHQRSFSTTAAISTSAALKLKSGQVFQGTSFGAEKSSFGEAVFTTSLVGYPESMTDPSYTGQILVFTQPLIGNYGVPGQTKDQFGLYKHFESDRIQVSGIIVNDYAAQYSHWTAVESLGEWCKRSNVPAITGIDTRALTHLLREQGSTLSQIVVGDEQAPTKFPDPNAENLVAKVSTKTPIQYNPSGDVKIAVVDCGVKQNILRCLTKRGASVTVLPHDFDFNKVADQFDGLFISNGPGSPVMCTETIKHLRVAIDHFNKPIFGICMGNLLLGMAAGLDVYKLPFGNRGHNQPALHVDTGLCYITSQNHGYALDDRVMPAGWKRMFVNANDGSNEGVRHESKPIFSVQFHPEAKGGPQDTEYLFEDFLGLVRAEKTKRIGLQTPMDQQQQTAAAAYA
ncbi:Multifunctional pyrimidine synthesis protein CAD [Apophysomyces sp. BC1034]|nr:Multifunctional pyrimidine synthesis protein CAD [Apophysomyces sp. BC1015]KAG0175883.1 Multifunctional pyrimidine synthesis protein CAD [Apophysomyces sp. BC1021]KAG0186304.1 Multifunctional pyrimidine synthesis protein CAD [Apophysomyces sp. BC1034]